MVNLWLIYGSPLPQDWGYDGSTQTHKAAEIPWKAPPTQTPSRSVVLRQGTDAGAEGCEGHGHVDDLKDWELQPGRARLSVDDMAHQTIMEGIEYMYYMIEYYNMCI